MIFFLYFFLLTALTIFSYGFIDHNLNLTGNTVFLTIQKPLSQIVYFDRIWAGLIFILVTCGLYIIYWTVLYRRKFVKPDADKLKKIFIATGLILLFSFPAFTYDIFNYITTAKVTFFHKENPYVVMPIEIPNEPYLAFTRAANKFALYGPTWLAFTAIPYVFGVGNIWQTIIAFKAVNMVMYWVMVYLVYRLSGNIRNAVFFGLNPLVIIEVLVSSHNDIFMMILALTGLQFAWKKQAGQRMLGLILWILSIFVKGATALLAPVFFLKHWTMEKRYVVSYWLMFAVFLLTPFREELYPWYALWFLTFMAVLPMEKYQTLRAFTIALCVGLSFRHLPYIFTREYGGYGPTLRILFTILPVSIYGVWRLTVRRTSQ